MTSNPSTSGESSRFVAPQVDAEDVLKAQTVGLVNLSEYRKRRAEAIEQTTRIPGDSSGASTPRDGALTPQPGIKKPKKKKTKGLLSFADEAEDAYASVGATPNISKANTPLPFPESGENSDDGDMRKKIGPNTKVGNAPKARTKASLSKQAETREQLRQEYLALQKIVKATEIVIPFVFFDGTNTPGGQVRVKKGDNIWLFLERARKVGAELGVGDSGRKGWARINVDDLMLIRGDLILPPHMDFYYFIANKSIGFHGPIFSYSADATKATPQAEADPEQDPNYDPLASRKKKDAPSTFDDDELEGFADDPTLTKVVDRRWYEKNKHIFPATLWEEYDSTKDYSKAIRKDAAGNVLFTT